MTEEKLIKITSVLSQRQDDNCCSENVFDPRPDKSH